MLLFTEHGCAPTSHYFGAEWDRAEWDGWKAGPWDERAGDHSSSTLDRKTPNRLFLLELCMLG